MKQVIITVPLFLLLLAILYLFTPVFPEKVSPESFIGPDAHLVVTQHDLKLRVEEFTASPLGQAVAHLRYQVVGRELGYSEEEIRDFLSTWQDIWQTYQNPMVQALIGTEFSLALLPFEAEEHLDLSRQVLDHLLLISRPGRKGRLLDLVSWTGAEDRRMTSVRYGSHTIVRFDLDNHGRIAVVRVKDLLLLSLDEHILRQGLDLYDQGGEGLRASAEYRSKIDRFDGASFLGYVNFEGLAGLLNLALRETIALGDRQVTFDKDVVAGYRSALFGAWRQDRTIIDKAVISFDPERLDARTREIMRREAALPGSYRQAPPDTIVYHWTNQFHLATILEMIGATGWSGEDGSPEPFLNQAAGLTGLTPEELVELFGDELTLAVKGMQETQLVPLPNFILALKTGDVERLKSAAETLIEHYSIPVRRRSLESAEIISWGGIIGMGSLLPALSFTDEALILSSNGEMIKNFVVHPREPSLADQKAFARLGPDLLKPANSMTYIDFARTTAMARELVSWGGTMLAIQDRELARKSKILIDELINPLLDGLAMYSIIGSRKQFQDTELLFEARTLVEDGKNQP